MSERLSGQAAIVTGAARGIGFAVARRLGEEGADVLLADVDAAEAAEELAASGISTAAVECGSATSLTARTPPLWSQRRSTASAASTSS